MGCNARKTNKQQHIDSIPPVITVIGKRSETYAGWFRRKVNIL
jgi:hypothetical protein